MIHTSIAQLTDVCQCRTEAVAGQCHGQRVKVAVADHPPAIDVDKRVVVHGRQLDVNLTAQMANGLAQGAMDLRTNAE